jgi:bifunctional non-homologous end joining protein LigD
VPLIQRKTILEKVIAKLPVRSPVQFSSDMTGRGPEFFKLACKRHLEGIISKRANAPYRSGRSGDWQKVKCKLRQEFVIGGYRRETTGRPNLGSLLLGYYERGRLIYAGSVGTGWSIQLGRSIMAALQRIGRERRRSLPCRGSTPRMRNGPSRSSSVRLSSPNEVGRAGRRLGLPVLS